MQQWRPQQIGRNHEDRRRTELMVRRSAAPECRSRFVRSSGTAALREARRSMGKTNRRQKQKRDSRARSQNTFRNLETPEAAMMRAILSRALTPSRRRIEARANVARRFESWRLNPALPQPGSSIALDDTGFSESITKNVTEQPVLHHALFPAMSAAENLTTVVHLVDQWDATGELRTSSIIALCRSALESASRTVWILSEVDRDERRNRALRVTKDEVLAQKKYVEEQIKRIDAGGISATDGQYAELEEALTAAKDVLDELSDVKHALKFDQTIERAAQWIDENMPNPSVKPMADLSKSMYAIASGITHGYTWATNYLHGTTDLSNIVADFLYAAATTTEAAVALYESQASATSTIAENCPPHLRDAAERLHRIFGAATADPTTQPATGPSSSAPHGSAEATAHC
uniref:Uncharacterized protein n=1 Tax=Rhodococcus sp. NS1 TaxID=402236 RepID=A0A097SPL1_9NOCA|nr:hypothetical protein LRS1606.12 [Rhodococcus sp. NS1]